MDRLRRGIMSVVSFVLTIVLGFALVVTPIWVPEAFDQGRDGPVYQALLFFVGFHFVAGIFATACNCILMNQKVFPFFFHLFNVSFFATNGIAALTLLIAFCMNKFWPDIGVPVSPWAFLFLAPGIFAGTCYWLILRNRVVTQPTSAPPTP